MAAANNNALPVAGLPAGSVSRRRPTLLPNFDTPVVGAGSAGGNLSPADFLAANPRVDALATAEFAGAATSADEITVDLVNPVLAAQSVPGNRISHTVVVASGDTLSNLAEKLADLFNDDAFCQAADIRADATLGVVTFRQGGPAGNLSVLSSPQAEGVVITLGGTSHTGDIVNALFTGPGLGGGVLIQTAPTTGQSATQMGDALVTAIAANSTLAGLSIIGTNTSGAVAISGVPVGDYQVTTWVNTGVPTAIVGGTPDTADLLTLTFTNASLPGGSHAVSYLTLVTDTTTALAAAGLLAAINNDTVLASAGITASLTGSTLTLLYPAAIGQLRFARSVTGTLTITLTAAPTTTAVASESETEFVLFASGSAGAVPATATAALGGSETDTDVISLVFTNAGVPGFPVTISHTAAGSESLASIAAALNTSINANATLKAAGVTSTVLSQTLTISQLGTIGNSTVLSYVQGGNTETITFTPSNGHLGGGTGSFASAPLTGGSGPILVTNNFDFAFNGQSRSFFYGNPYIVDYPLLQALANSGEPIV